MDLWSSLLVTGGSTCSFRLVNRLIGCLPTPEPARKKSWRWRNISTSLVHSTLTGAWAVLCFYLHPEMARDLISTHSLFSHSLVAVSTGYFIHDFLDLAFNQSLKKSWEVMLHHAMVISCFSLALTSRLYVGFAVVSLLVEINSIFLHVRQLLLLAGQRNRPVTCATKTTSHPSTAYRLISLLNLATFLMFRVCTLGWMTRWLAVHGKQVPCLVLTLGTVGLSIITTMSTVLFYRLLRADVF